MAEESRKPANLTNYILILLLVVAAFLAGMYVKDSSGKGEGTGQQAGADQPVPGNPEAVPEEEAPLSDADWQKIIVGGAAEKGEKDAPVTIVEFSEYECPFCQRYVLETYSKVMGEYGDKIRYVFHDYPLPFHQNAQLTSEAARCAGDQDKYWEMHDELFAKRDEWAEAADAKKVILGLAQTLGLNQAKFSACLDEGKFTQAVKDDLALGQTVGVSGTPSFFINGQKLVGAQPFEAFKAVIEAELED